MLVVIVLAGILVSIVTISVAPDPRQKLTREAVRVGQLMALAADESRIRQLPIAGRRTCPGYRFVTEVRWRTAAADRRRPAARTHLGETDEPAVAVQDGGGPQPAQVLLGPGAPPVRMAIAREWVQPRWRLELSQ